MLDAAIQKGTEANLLPSFITKNIHAARLSLERHNPLWGSCVCVPHNLPHAGVLALSYLKCRGQLFTGATTLSLRSRLQAKHEKRPSKKRKERQAAIARGMQSAKLVNTKEEPTNMLHNSLWSEQLTLEHVFLFRSPHVSVQVQKLKAL